MRAVAVIAAALVAIIGMIVFQFYSASQSNVVVVPDVANVPEPSQMMAPEYSTALIDYLQQSAPDVWHQVALGWNWDGGLAPLAWMIRQPQCDRGTALLIYWRGGPGWFNQYASGEEVPLALSDDLYDLLEEVESRLMSGFYVRQEIAFNPRNDESYDWTTRYDDVPAKRKIPGQLYEATPGREILKPCVYLRSGLRC